MKKNLITTGIAATLLFMFACTKPTSTITVAPKITDLYISGDSTTSGYYSIVKYWKNGIPVDCGTQLPLAGVLSMAVSGSDVYLAGGFYNMAQMFAMAWKNGAGVKLSSGPMGNTAYSVKVSGTDVYYGGSVAATQDNIMATYWKNGVQVSITDGKIPAKVQDMAISGSDLSLLIVQDDNSSISAKIWKNGVVKDLFTGTGHYRHLAQFGEMAIDNSDVYVAATLPATTGNRIAAYFKNGVATKISDSTANAYAYSICISGKDVFLAGTAIKSISGQRDINRATYWKNGTVVYLTDGTHDANASSVKVLGEDVYVAGYESNGKFNIAKYWKNGVAVNLSNGTTDNTACNIVIVQH